MTFEEIKNVFKNDGFEKALEQLAEASFLKRLDEPEEIDFCNLGSSLKVLVMDYRSRGISPSCVFVSFEQFALHSVSPNTEIIVNQNDPSTLIAYGVACRAHPDVAPDKAWVF